MKWIIFSHGFNMDGRAASLTVTDKIPYFLSSNIEPIIISAKTGHKDKMCSHHQLFPWGPSGLFFDLRHWYRVHLKKNTNYKIFSSIILILLLPFQILERLLFGFSSQWSWAFPAALKAYKINKKNKIDVIYSSGGAWSAHYAAWIIKKLTGIKWIAEIHDPMVPHINTNKSITTKYREYKFIKKLEKRICTNADVVVWFTESAKKHAKLRNPQLKNKGIVIYPGSHPGFEKPLPTNHTYTNTLSINHFGSLANNRSLLPLLEALSKFFEQKPDAKKTIKIHMYGAPLDSTSQEAIIRFNMKNIVIAHGRLPYRDDIFKLMRTSDLLLLLHGDYDDCNDYIPSKLYDYFWTNRPIFALCHKQQELESLLQKRQSYISCTTDQQSIFNTLNQIWNDWNSKNLRTQIFDPISSQKAVEKMINAIKTISTSKEDNNRQVIDIN